MTKKRKFSGFSAVMHHWIKPIIKGSTHVLTISGVVVAASPVLRGAGELAHGRVTDAKNAIIYDTTGSTGQGSVTVMQSVNAAVSNVAVPLAIGTALIVVGAFIRKRIGS